MDGHDDPTPTPTRMWFALLRRLGRGLTGRRISVRDTAFTVASLHGKPDGFGWSLGRARDVAVVLRDVTAPELDAQELVIECDSLMVGPTVTATGVTVTTTMSPDAFAAFGAQDESSPRVHVVDGELRSPWLPGIELVLRPEVTEEDLRFTPTAVITPLGRWSSWGILPSGTAPSPDLPGGLRITEITTTDDAVLVRSAIDRWTAAQGDRPRLRELLAAASQDRSTSGTAGHGVA
jgi:hypothetical protein